MAALFGSGEGAGEKDAESMLVKQNAPFLQVKVLSRFLRVSFVLHFLLIFLVPAIF
jgi:hypothetical protein